MTRGGRWRQGMNMNCRLKHRKCINWPIMFKRRRWQENWSGKGPDRSLLVTNYTKTFAWMMLEEVVITDQSFQKRNIKYKRKIHCFLFRGSSCFVLVSNIKLVRKSVSSFSYQCLNRLITRLLWAILTGLWSLVDCLDGERARWNGHEVTQERKAHCGRRVSIGWCSMWCYLLNVEARKASNELLHHRIMMTWGQRVELEQQQKEEMTMNIVRYNTNSELIFPIHILKINFWRRSTRENRVFHGKWIF